MNKKLTLLTVSMFCWAGTSALCDETNLLARWGAPTNEFVACADPVNQSVNSDDVAESLGIKHWTFLVQVPESSFLTTGFHWTGNGAHDLGYFSIPVDRMDHFTGKIIPGPFQDRILVMMYPVDNSDEDSWRNSAKLHVFIKDYDSHISNQAIIDNPFRTLKKTTKTTTVNNSAPMAAHDHSVKPGSVEQAMGTQFDLMTTVIDNGQNRGALRISFEEGLHLTFK